MRRTTAVIRAPMLALAVTGLLAAPVAAAPLATTSPSVGSNVQMVRDHRSHFDRDIHRDHDGYYYHGHRVYDHYHRGYREYNGWWLPPALFLGGMLLGGAMADHGGAMSNNHYRWCEEHYRSYDPRTDTFQPYHGPRRRCVSPYD